MAERVKYVSFIIFSFVLTLVIYPVVGHWIWGGGWLADLGFKDFAGDAAVHSVGGWAALAGAMLLGPRIGKYGRDGKPRAIPGHSMSLAVIGLFVLWLGWFGFNPGSTMSFQNPSDVLHILMTTNTSAIAAVLTSTITSWIVLKKPDLGMTVNGCLAGLVAVTGGCAYFSIEISLLVGALSGVLVVLAVSFFDRLKIDDPVGATAVHLCCGVFGTICVGLFAQSGVTSLSTVDGLFFGGGFGLLGIQPSVPEKVEGEKANCGRSGIVIENVTFSYDKNRTVLDKVCIDVPKGSTVALCGQSGCGKSTLVNLVMHFNEPASGDIYLDGTNLRNISHAALRKNVTLVPQSTYIFSGTVEDNLRIVDKSLTEERMLQALKQVKLESLIEKEGLKTDVGENGSKLSGGQKQKIGIARAILSDCEYMVFDEATSSVDAESEEDIWNCIHDISKEKTLLIISHRLSTIRNADRIYVLDHGSVVESGKHAELMKIENYGRRETSERN